MRITRLQAWVEAALKGESGGSPVLCRNVPCCRFPDVHGIATEIAPVVSGFLKVADSISVFVSVLTREFEIFYGGF